MGITYRCIIVMQLYDVAPCKAITTLLFKNKITYFGTNNFKNAENLKIVFNSIQYIVFVYRFYTSFHAMFTNRIYTSNLYIKLISCVYTILPMHRVYTSCSYIMFHFVFIHHTYTSFLHIVFIHCTYKSQIYTLYLYIVFPLMPPSIAFFPYVSSFSTWKTQFMYWPWWLQSGGPAPVTSSLMLFA